LIIDTLMDFFPGVDPSENTMRTLSYTVGNWHAEASLLEVDTGKLMAVIRLSDERDADLHASTHTIVFDHQKGKDEEKETEILIRRLLRKRYGN
jgi:hypothetical protein